MTGDNEPVRLAIGDGVATITLNRPPLNILDIATMSALNNALEEALGNRETGVLLRHALRNAAVPVITVIGSGFALLISGVVALTLSPSMTPRRGRYTPYSDGRLLATTCGIPIARSVERAIEAPCTKLGGGMPPSSDCW